MYKKYFKVYGLSEDSLDTAIKISKGRLKKEFDVIISKHEIILHYKLTKTILKFNKYDKNNYILDYNIAVYLESLIEAACYLKNNKDYSKFISSIKLYIHTYKIFSTMELYYKIQKL